MRQNAIRTKLAAGQKVVNGWCSIASTQVAELMAHQGYDSITIDLQHGAMHFETAFGMLQAISTTNATPMVRVPWNEPGLIMKLLDAGAYGVICPMINTANEAESFVEACCYPPGGTRSFGPNRAVQYSQSQSGAEYAKAADAEILRLVMIETQAALQNLSEILAIERLDGVYVGPGDLSLALGATPTMAPSDTEVLNAMSEIKNAAHQAGKIAAVHTDGPSTARKRFSEGFDLCTLQNDVRLLIEGASAQVRAART